MAVVEDDMSIVRVGSSMDIEALATVVSNVLDLSRVPLDLLGVGSSVWSDNSSNVDLEALASLVGNSVLSLGEGSDGLSSGIEDPPLLVVVWIVVLDSESILVVSDVLSEVQGSLVGEHSRSDLELNSRSKWLNWVVNSLLVEVPSLVGSIVAVVPNGPSLVMVISTVDIEASSSNISDVLDASSVPSDLLEGFSLGWSHDRIVALDEPVVTVQLNGHSEVSVRHSSD